MDLDSLMDGGSGKDMPRVIMTENANVTQDVFDKLIDRNIGFNELLVKMEDSNEGLIGFIETKFDGNISAYWDLDFEYLTLVFKIDAPGVSETKLDQHVDKIDAFTSKVANKLIDSLDEIEGHDDVKIALRENWYLTLKVTLNGEEYEV